MARGQARQTGAEARGRTRAEAEPPLQPGDNMPQKKVAARVGGTNKTIGRARNWIVKWQTQATMDATQLKLAMAYNKSCLEPTHSVFAEGDGSEGSEGSEETANEPDELGELGQPDDP